ncbi:MAG: transglutaminase-like domain-containing protein, partial [Candidatus Tectomicrobia bacterium]|nr:transglutaminase-like domain-containing protein [Candidatus Tectomicrobia bacterium]
MLILKLRSVVTLCFLLIALIGTRALGAEAETPPPSHRDLQRAIVEGLASGRDVTAELEAFQQQAAPRTHRVSRRSSAVAGNVKDQLRLLQQALHHAPQGTVSVAALTALEQAYEQAQAAHLLMIAHFESVREDLDASAAPSNFERRRRDALALYSETLEALLAPLSVSMAQLGRHPDRDTLIASVSFRRELKDAIRDTLARLPELLQEPPPAILRAQTLPVRRATFAPRTPRLEPVLQPVYDQTPTPQPHPDDVASAPDAPLRAEIVAQAEALDYDAVRIYEFVRNTIAVEWYAGAMKGAVGTLRQQLGNAVDQASLLIALLRASGVPARYVHGVVRLPIDAVMSSLGLTEAAQATRALTAAGVAYSPVIQGGGVAAVDIE